MKENKIYSIFAKRNLEFIIRKAVKKKFSLWIHIDNEVDVNNFNLLNNWRIEKKKPPDKIVDVELLCRCKVIVKKVKKPNGKRKKRRRKEQSFNNYQPRDISKSDLITRNFIDQNLKEIRLINEKVDKFTSDNGKLLLHHQSEVDEGQANKKNDLGVGLAVAQETLQETESERGIGFHNTTVGDEDNSTNGHGYTSIKKINSQRVHSRRGNHQVILFASLFVKEEELETGAYARLMSCKLMKRFQRVENCLKFVR
jgi:hypothetical protein